MADVLTLEQIQRSVAKILLKADWKTPHEVLLPEMGWPSLK